MAYGILIPQPTIEPWALSVKAWRMNHWATRAFPNFCSLNLRLWVTFWGSGPRALAEIREVMMTFPSRAVGNY